jgi:peptidoglycan/LPS O-acetylase OafA/YrhL
MKRQAQHAPQVGDATGRLHYVDWLRVLAVLMLFPFHVSRVFNHEAFYVKHADLSGGLGQFIAFMDVWQMQLLFFLAGASTFFALRRRGPGGYLVERVKRLLVPFLFGFLVLIPPQTWYGGRFNSGYQESVWHYMTSGDWLEWNIRDGGDYFGGFGIGHLWFILVLFLLSVGVLPLLLGGRDGRGARAQARVARFLGRPGAWLVAAVFVMFGEALPQLELSPFYYLTFFILGYLALGQEAFPASALRFRLPTLLGGIALTVFYISTGDLRDSQVDPSFALAGLNLLGFLATWLMIVGLVGYGRRYLDRRSAALAYLAEGSYPIYLLHQTVIVVLAFYLVELPGPAVVNWFLLLAGAVGLTFGLYEGVRRLPLRVLLGMRARRPQAGSEAAAPLPDSGRLAL